MIDTTFFAVVGYFILWFSYIPQIRKLYERKSSDDLSIMWLALLTLALCLITIFSFTTTVVIYILGNIVSVFFCVVLIVMAEYYRRNGRREYE